MTSGFAGAVIWAGVPANSIVESLTVSALIIDGMSPVMHANENVAGAWTVMMIVIRV
jgi:hypothetical protein